MTARTRTGGVRLTSVAPQTFHYASGPVGLQIEPVERRDDGTATAWTITRAWVRPVGEECAVPARLDREPWPRLADVREAIARWEDRGDTTARLGAGGRDLYPHLSDREYQDCYDAGRVI